MEKAKKREIIRTKNSRRTKSSRNKLSEMLGKISILFMNNKVDIFIGTLIVIIFTLLYSKKIRLIIQQILQKTKFDNIKKENNRLFTIAMVDFTNKNEQFMKNISYLVKNDFISRKKIEEIITNVYINFTKDNEILRKKTKFDSDGRLEILSTNIIKYFSNALDINVENSFFNKIKNFLGFTIFPKKISIYEQNKIKNDINIHVNSMELFVKSN